MSTKLTTKTDTPPIPLSVLLETATRALLHALATRLREQGFAGLTPPHLVLFGHLDCGATHASLIAQRMGVSRQAISRTLRDLQELGFLRQEGDETRGNQKQVVMTPQGERLALAGRAELSRLESALAKELGSGGLAALRHALTVAGVTAALPPTAPDRWQPPGPAT